MRWVHGRFPAVLVLVTVFGSGAAAAAERTDRAIDLTLDASDVGRKILHASLTIPSEPGSVTLYYPKWIPGEHGPTGPITDLAGVRISAGGKSLPWRRAGDDMHALSVEAPMGTTQLEVSLDVLLPPSSVDGFSSAASSTAKMAVLNWNQVLLYPAGLPASEIRVRAGLTLPAGWSLGTALPVASRAGRTTRFSPVSLVTLIDSPVICGEHFREVPLGVVGGASHFVEMAADSDEALEVPPETRAAWGTLVKEGMALFGAHPYGSYRFLLALSDGVAHFGLEHHESSDNRVWERMLLDDDLRKGHATLLPHELVHAWNGKYRRPVDMVTTDFQEPLNTSLLWVYEGLTQYLGQILTARSGLWSAEDYRDKLALIAEWASNQAGRSWRSVEDTSVSAQLLFEARDDWEAWRRSTDFYDEGVLIWLDVDTLIRDKTAGRKSLVDFLRRFHGGQSGPPRVVTYTFNDVVATLNTVLPYDWSGFLKARAEAVSPKPPLDGLARSGWRLVYTPEPSPLQKAYEAQRKEIDLSASLGIVLRQEGGIKDVIPGKPAHRAGIGPGMKLLAVNGRRWSKERLRQAVAATSESEKPLELLVENGEFIRSYTIEYRDGERYPRLERIPGKDDLLSIILRTGS